MAGKRKASARTQRGEEAPTRGRPRRNTPSTYANPQPQQGAEAEEEEMATVDQPASVGGQLAQPAQSLTPKQTLQQLQAQLQQS